VVVVVTTEQEASVSEVSTIGLDLAKYVFQAHGADASGKVVFRKRLRREKVLEFLAGKPACVVAMEACSSAHHWARELARLGHIVRLIPPAYVKPFVKRQKNDAADAEAICEAAQRPTMRFVAVKSETAQANAVVFRARDLLIRQRTQAINALRGHLGEYGLVAAKGPGHVIKLVEHVKDPCSEVPDAARLVLRTLIEAPRFLSERIDLLDREIARRAREDDDVRRLTSIASPSSCTRRCDTAPSSTPPSQPAPTGQEVEPSSRAERRPREGADDGADSVACDHLTDCDFNRAAPHPADPIKCHMSTQRTQTPEAVDIATNQPPSLDPLENTISGERPFAIGRPCDTRVVKAVIHP
jgi:transposase